MKGVGWIPRDWRGNEDKSPTVIILISEASASPVMELANKHFCSMKLVLMQIQVKYQIFMSHHQLSQMSGSQPQS